MVSTVSGDSPARRGAPETPTTLPSCDGRVLRVSYAAELLLEEVFVPEDFESEDDEDGVEVDVDGLDDAGELLDEEPRLSLR
jgi:hypothetical protein